MSVLTFNLEWKWARYVGGNDKAEFALSENAPAEFDEIND